MGKLVTEEESVNWVNNLPKGDLVNGSLYPGLDVSGQTNVTLDTTNKYRLMTKNKCTSGTYLHLYAPFVTDDKLLEQNDIVAYAANTQSHEHAWKRYNNKETGVFNLTRQRRYFNDRTVTDNYSWAREKYFDYVSNSIKIFDLDGYVQAAYCLAETNPYSYHVDRGAATHGPEDHIDYYTDHFWPSSSYYSLDTSGTQHPNIASITIGNDRKVYYNVNTNSNNYNQGNTGTYQFKILFNKPRHDRYILVKYKLSNSQHSINVNAYITSDYSRCTVIGWDLTWKWTFSQQGGSSYVYDEHDSVDVNDSDYAASNKSYGYINNVNYTNGTNGYWFDYLSSCGGASWNGAVGNDGYVYCSVQVYGYVYCRNNQNPTYGSGYKIEIGSPGYSYPWSDPGGCHAPEWDSVQGGGYTNTFYVIVSVESTDFASVSIYSPNGIANQGNYNYNNGQGFLSYL